MNFRDRLQSGAHGARVRLPDLENWKEGGNTGRGADPERGVLWRFAFSPWSVDLRDEHEDVLRSDIEREARHAFEEAHEEMEWPPGSGKKLAPRTADPAWSPIVDMERTSIEGAEALRIIDRITYRPGNEIVVGRLQVPLRRGSFHVGAYARAETTGMRESVLMTLAAKASKDGATSLLAQQEYDDPKHDDEFADSPLSRARAAIRWLLDPEGGGLTVTEPMEEIASDEVVLEEARCSIVAPPRYVLVPPEVANSNMTMLVRPLLSDDSNRMLDLLVYERRLETGHLETAFDLAKLAEADAQAWESEGVTGIETEARVLDRDDDKAHVLCHIRFRVGDNEKRTAARWLMDTDGWVFRACVSGPSYLPKKELAKEADRVIRSLRRLDPPDSGRRKNAAAVEPKKPWWQFW